MGAIASWPIASCKMSPEYVSDSLHVCAFLFCFLLLQVGLLLPSTTLPHQLLLGSIIVGPVLMLLLSWCQRGNGGLFE